MDMFWHLAISLVVAVVSAVVTVKLAFRQFLAERWWERKADAYASILEALHVMKRGLEDDFNQIAQNRATDKRYEKEQQKKYRAARDQMHKAVDTGSFLLASDATSLLQELESNLAKADIENIIDGHCVDYFGVLTDQIDATRTCLKRLPLIARRDLRIPVEPLERATTTTTGAKAQKAPRKH